MSEKDVYIGGQPTEKDLLILNEIKPEIDNFLEFMKLKNYLAVVILKPAQEGYNKTLSAQNCGLGDSNLMMNTVALHTLEILLSNKEAENKAKH